MKGLFLLIWVIAVGGLLAVTQPSSAQKIRIFSLINGTESEYLKEGKDFEFIDLTVESLEDADLWFAKVFPRREYVIYDAQIPFPWPINKPVLPKTGLFSSPWMLVEKRSEGVVVHVDATHYRGVADEHGSEELRSDFLALDYPSASCMQEVIRKYPEGKMDCVPERWKSPIKLRLAAVKPYGFLPFEFRFVSRNERCIELFAPIYSSIYSTIAKSIVEGKEKSFNANDFYPRFDCSQVE